MFFYGGCWRQGSVNQFIPHAEHLSNLSITAVIADYRVFLRHGSTVADAVSDAKSAIRWLRSHAEQLGIDPQRIAAAGGSAGGHLAVATAMIDGYDSAEEDLSISSRPNALVLFNPAVNTGSIGESRPAQFPGDAEILSPYHRVGENFVPTLIMHGHDDTTVPCSDVVDFCDKVIHLAGDCTLIGYEGATHGFFNKGRDNDLWYQSTIAEMDMFLTEIGYLEEHGMTHTRGKPYHPQTQGKIERWHRSMKNQILLNNYYFPSELENHLHRFVGYYNHESLDNLTPADVYYGRKQAILEHREKIKLKTP